MPTLVDQTHNNRVVDDSDFLWIGPHNNSRWKKKNCTLLFHCKEKRKEHFFILINITMKLINHHHDRKKIYKLQNIFWKNIHDIYASAQNLFLHNYVVECRIGTNTHTTHLFSDKTSTIRRKKKKLARNWKKVHVCQINFVMI